MSITRLFAFTYRNFIFAKTNFFAFMELLFWPIVGLVSVGVMSSFLALQQNFLGFILSGAIISGVLQVTQLDVSYSLLYDVWSKSIKHTFSAPITEFEYITGSWIIGMARGLVVLLMLAFASGKIFGFYLPPLLNTLVFVVGIFLNSLIIGMMVCFLILNWGQKVEVTAWSLSQVVMLLCGIYYPVNYLPKSLTFLSQFIPLTYFMEYLRKFYGFTPYFPHSLLKGFALTFIYIMILFGLLRYAFIRAKKTGMILRLSE